MIRELISFYFDPRTVLLSPHVVFSFVKSAVVCASFERTSGFELASRAIALNYLKLEVVTKFCLLTFISLWMSLALVVISILF